MSDVKQDAQSGRHANGTRMRRKPDRKEVVPTRSSFSYNVHTSERLPSLFQVMGYKSRPSGSRATEE